MAAPEEYVSVFNDLSTGSTLVNPGDSRAASRTTTPDPS